MVDKRDKEVAVRVVTHAPWLGQLHADTDINAELPELLKPVEPEPRVVQLEPVVRHPAVVEKLHAGVECAVEPLLRLVEKREEREVEGLRQQPEVVEPPKLFVPRRAPAEQHMLRELKRKVRATVPLLVCWQRVPPPVQK